MLALKTTSYPRKLWTGLESPNLCRKLGKVYEDVLKAHKEAEFVMELNLSEDPTPSPKVGSGKKQVVFKADEDEEEEGEE